MPFSLPWHGCGSTASRCATSPSRRACEPEGLQFLDETVAISGLRLERDGRRLRLQPTYAFEFSGSGFDRRPGSIVMLGQTVRFVNAGLRLAE